MYAENQSDKFLTVGGLKVLGNVESQNISQIKRDVQETFDKTQNLTAQQKDFYSAIANDNIVTPVEKKQIKQELAVIAKSYTRIMEIAQEKGELENTIIKMYKAKYEELVNYINNIRLFDKMTENTTVEKTEFTDKFADYYDAEIVAQSIFTGKTSTTIRVLASLFESGAMNEVALYRDVFYKWNGEKWELVSGSEYLGIWNRLPSANINDYFLCAVDFTAPLKLYSNKGFFAIGGKKLAINHTFKKGYIYLSTSSGWQKVNKDDYRYLLASADLSSIGEESKPASNLIVSNTPTYLGSVYELPTVYKKNDWFTWAGPTTEDYIQGKVYKWNGEEWEEVIAKDTKNYQMLMTALTDILASNPTGEGYFSTVFAQALIASNAFIQNLQSQIITLTQTVNEQGQVIEGTGVIQSKNYLTSQGTEGWQIRADGTAEFKNNCFMTNVTIGDKAVILGDAMFMGKIDSGPLLLDDIDPGAAKEQEIIMGKASDLFNWCKNNGWDIKRASGSSSPGTILNGFYPEHLNGTVGGIPFSQIYWHCNTNAVIGHFRFADKYGNFVTGKYEYFTRDSGENDSIPEIILDKYTPGGRTFVLKDLPTSETALKGAIYHDTQGFLKITL